MIAPRLPHDELVRLVESIRSGTASAADRELLETAVATDDETCRAYIRLVRLETGIARYFASSSLIEPSFAPLSGWRAPASSRHTLLPQSSRHTPCAETEAEKRSVVSGPLSVGEAVSGQRSADSGQPEEAGGWRLEEEESEIINQKSEIPPFAPSPSPLSPSPIPHSAIRIPQSTSPSSLPSFRIPRSLQSRPLAFSIFVATVATSLVLLVFGQIRFGSDSLRVAARPGQGGSGFVSAAPFVAQWTNSANCRWVNNDAAPIPGARLRAGQSFDLRSGVIEVRFKSGAVAVVEGPARFVVEENNLARLERGRLVARVETKKASGFTVVTPSVRVVDLGTEFGVEVRDDGTTLAHVFRGEIRVHPVKQADSDKDSVLLRENDSTRVEIAKGRPLIVYRDAAAANVFTRHVPRRVPIKVFSTGVRTAEGKPDPHWELAAISYDPGFAPRPATVAAIPHHYYRNFLPNDPDRSQWIGVEGEISSVPDQAVYTFRTTFDLGGASPESAVLRCKFLADDRVEAIRLNGKGLEVPPHNDSVFFFELHEFTIADGFVEGVNVFEIDVFNGAPGPATPGSVGPMACRIELAGYAVLGSPKDSAATARENH